jgi:hypothetical protein
MNGTTKRPLKASNFHMQIDPRSANENQMNQLGSSTWSTNLLIRLVECSNENE